MSKGENVPSVEKKKYGLLILIKLKDQKLIINNYKTMENFLPENYKVPDTGGYMKFKEGENQFRVMSSAVVGYEYFTKENQPIRSKSIFTSTPDIKEDGKVKHFWAFVVYNYETSTIQILELTQKTIQTPVKAYVDNEKWGDPKDYDITVIKVGDGLQTEYSVTVNPKSEVTDDVKELYANTNIDLEQLFSGEDPLNPTVENISFKDEEAK